MSIEELRKARQEKNYAETELNRLEKMKLSTPGDREAVATRIEVQLAEVDFWNESIREIKEDLAELLRHNDFLISKLEGIKKSLAGVFNEFASIDRGSMLRMEQVRAASLELIGPRDRIDALLIGLRSDKKQIESALLPGK
jgi:hypothetical protein